MVKFSKGVHFAKGTKEQTPVSPPISNNFELGMNLLYKDGQGNNEAVVYEGDTLNGKHIVRRKDGTKLYLHICQ